MTPNDEQAVGTEKSLIRACTYVLGRSVSTNDADWNVGETLKVFISMLISLNTASIILLEPVFGIFCQVPILLVPIC